MQKLVLVLSCCLLFSCSRDPAQTVSGSDGREEISLRFLGQKSLFGVVINEYELTLNLLDDVVDSVDVIVIEEGEEFVYGSLLLEGNKGCIEKLKVPDFVTVIYVDCMDGSGAVVRERMVKRIE